LVIMLRFNVVLVLAFAGLTAAPVSADFIDAPPGGLRASAQGMVVQPSTRIDPRRDYSVPELWRDSAYLELGYYSLEGETSRKLLARPNDAELSAASHGDQASLFGVGSFGGQSAGAFTRLSFGVASLIGLAAFATRRHWLGRRTL
jgi:hypothetical protein